MFRRLDVGELIASKQLSKYELGVTEPPLPILLRYAQVATRREWLRSGLVIRA
jgi:hypothetical protein